MTLTAEQRRALALLANADGNGATQQLLAAHSFGVPMVAGLVNDGLATLTREQMSAGGAKLRGKLVEVGKVRPSEPPLSRHFRLRLWSNAPGYA